MPNWVANRLVVDGPADVLAAFADAVSSANYQGESQALDFERTLPTPAELGDGRPDEELPTLPAWRQWRVHNWGTKWNARDATIEEGSNDQRLVYRFLTAWAPPEAWVLDASSRFPQLDFELEFFEEYQQFCGRIRWRSGSCTLAEDREPHSLAWVEWEEDDDGDEEQGRWWADPLPAMADIPEQALERAAELVGVAVRATSTPWAERHLASRYLQWMAAITEQLGQAGRAARMIDYDPESSDGTVLLEDFCRSVMLAASEAIHAAEHVHAPGGVRIIRPDHTPRVQEALDDATSDRDRAWSGSTPLDWLAELLENFSYVNSELLSAELSRYREDVDGRTPADPEDEGRESDIDEVERLAQRCLVSFAGNCIRALAMLAPEDFDAAALELSPQPD